MPKNLPRDQRLTATVSIREKKTAERLVREIDGIENMSDLVRQLLKERLARHLTEKKASRLTAKTSKLIGGKKVLATEPSRKRRARNSAASSANSSATENAAQ